MHRDQIAVVDLPEPVAGCEECLATGSRWVHPRMCQTCGRIGCCDSSPDRHASRHAEASGHPIRALKADGGTRPGYEGIAGALAAADLGAVTAAVGRATAALGVSFGKGRKRRPFQLDAVPRLLGASEWHGLAVGMRQRARALNAFIADVYGDRRIVAAGVMPARVIDSAEGYEPDLVGVVAPGGHAPVVGFDLVRGGDGRFSILEENLRTPSGLAYSRAARLIIDEAVPCEAPGERLDPGASYAALGSAIRAAAPDGGGDPSAAVLSDGPTNSAWYEHRELALRRPCGAARALVRAP